ncbi:MAG TPA: glycosyltransferase family 2 protein [Granulicella sp.]|jgi:glycosyltransferase involved in cell wall biosynthesis|nr:glycosyltransferase family 2 protein [Granulicella sp.]
MTAKYGLSVAIVACNEADNLARTLASVVWADEIVLIDSGSTDRTVEIARRYGATVYTEPWKGYGPQVNSALDKCTRPWLLNLDADEVLSPELAAEIQALLRTEPEFSGYTVPRLNLIFGRWMRHGGLYPDRKLRLFRQGFARLREDTEPHATPIPTSTGPTGALRGDLLHYQYPTLPLYQEHMRRYSTASVPLMLRRGKTSRTPLAYFANTVLNPAFTFLYNYIVRGGFLDGREGLLFHINHSRYVRWRYVKARDAARRGQSSSIPAANAQPEQTNSKQPA